MSSFRFHIEGRSYSICLSESGLIAIMENSIEVLQKIKTELPHDPVMPLWCVYTKEII